MAEDTKKRQSALIHWVLDHPKIAGFAAFLALAVAFTPKASATASWICLGIAIVFGIAMLLGTAEKQEWGRPTKVLTTVLLVVGILFFGLWLTDAKKSIEDWYHTTMMSPVEPVGQWNQPRKGLLVPPAVSRTSVLGKHFAGPPRTVPHYDHAHLVVTQVQLWAAPMFSEAMVTVRNIGSKPVMPCALLRGAIITSTWLNGSDAEDRLFTQWQQGGKGWMNCDTDWNPGVDKTYSIQLSVAGENGIADWTSLAYGEKVWYVVSRLAYRDSDTGPALPTIENCVFFRAEKPEWTMNQCFGHNDPTLVGKWLSGSGREATESNPMPKH